MEDSNELDADQSWDHLWRSQYASPDKARALLGFEPGEPEACVREAVDWLRRHGDLQHLGT